MITKLINLPVLRFAVTWRLAYIASRAIDTRRKHGPARAHDIIHGALARYGPAAAAPMTAVWTHHYVRQFAPQCTCTDPDHQHVIKSEFVMDGVTVDANQVPAPIRWATQICVARLAEDRDNFDALYLALPTDIHDRCQHLDALLERATVMTA